MIHQFQRQIHRKRPHQKINRYLFLIQSGFLFIPLLNITVASASPELSNNIPSEILQKCLEARDFEGCIDSNISQDANEQTALENNDPLRDQMKKTAKLIRKSRGFEEASDAFQSLEQFSLDEDAISLSSQVSSKVSQIFLKHEQEWTSFKKAHALYNPSYGKLHSCNRLKKIVNSFNSDVGSEVVKYTAYVKAPITGMHVCNERSLFLHERDMLVFLAGSLEEGAIDPNIILEFNEAAKVKEDLANQDSWSKYLNEKPGLKAWSSANPSAAEKARIKWNKKNPTKLVKLPKFLSTLKFLNRFKPAFDEPKS